MNSFKFTCLGGCGEIGMNLYLYESADDAIVVDCGVQFADPDRLGIDSILPDLSYLDSIQNKLRAVIFTHGHEDHIGAAAYLLERFPLPVYASRFTLALLTYKLAQQGIDADLHTIRDKETLCLGRMELSFFVVPHSIPDSMGLVIQAEGFMAMHLSDFRAKGLNISFLPDIQPNCLMLDATNAMSRTIDEGEEEDVAAEFTRLFASCEGRVFVTTFSSNIGRIAAVIKAARATGRRLVLEGGAMERAVNTAFSLGLLQSAGDISSADARRENPKSLVYAVSGCQGEHASALYNIAMGERKNLLITEGDMLIFSSRVIPGNEGNINRIINAVLRSGGEVVRPDDAMVHISGHALPPVLEAVIGKLSPDWLVPVHGEYQHMLAERSLAVKAGMQSEKVLILETGNALTFHAGGHVEATEVAAERRYFDSRGGFYLLSGDLSERGRLARDGAVAVRLCSGEADIMSIGFPMDEAAQMAAKDFISEGSLEDGETEPQRIKRVLKRFFKKYMKRRPVIAVFEDN